MEKVTELDQRVELTNDEGDKVEMNLLFKYHSDEFNCDFILLYEDEDDENVVVFKLLEDDSIDIVEDPAMLEEAQKVLDKYNEQIDKLDK